MSATSGAFAPNSHGYNQSGGGYFYVVDTTATGVWTKLNTFTPGSGSGGATGSGTVAAIDPIAENTVGGAVSLSSLFLAGRVVRDMGKTVISAGRTFRKIQGVDNKTGVGQSTGGVTGAAPGYASYYVETSLTGNDVPGPGATATNGPAGLVRFM